MTSRNVVGSVFTSIAPSMVTEKDGLVYTYFRNTTNDTVYITNLTDNSSWTVILPGKNCNTSVAPDRSKVILWSRDNS